MVRWVILRCPPDTGFEIRALAVWGRARYLSVTEAPHNTDLTANNARVNQCSLNVGPPSTTLVVVYRLAIADLSLLSCLLELSDDYMSSLWHYGSGRPYSLKIKKFLVNSLMSFSWHTQWIAYIEPMPVKPLTLFKPEFTFVIFIHYKPRIAVAILDLQVDEDDWKWVKNLRKLPWIGKTHSWKFPF